jgi:TPR repeat protein
MADVAHDTSSPASLEPGDIAPQQASRPDSPDRGKLRVFISYSRDDLNFANQLNAALDAYGFECFIDREGISGGEKWKRRIGSLISEADTVVFVLSPTSARSEICAWEVEEAARLNKRILPVNCRPLEGTSPPPRLRDLNYIFFYEDPKIKDSGFGTGLKSLIAALNTDFDWLREHTRYLQRAIEWDKGGRPANRLLSGDDIAEAKAWVARRPKNAPEPTALHLDFIGASEEEAEARSSAQRKQLEAMAAAQAEREKALHEAEEAQRKRATMARVRNIALVAVSIFAVLAGLLALYSVQQRKLAEEQRAVAEERRERADRILRGATNIIQKLQDQMPIDTKKEVFAVFQAGADHGDVTAMRNLGITYHYGHGVAQDDAKAREWFEKAADKGDASAMSNLGSLYENGYGVPQDYAKAREWYEKAAGKGDASAMTNLGRLYASVEQDYAKAREWWEKAADKGDASAKAKLEQLSISEAFGAGRYAEALQLQEALAAKMVEGKAAKETAQALNSVAWYGLFAREFTKALTVAERAHALLPDELAIETNRAHALMFLGREKESKALYLAHRGKPIGQDGELWERAIAEDFAEFRKAGLTHPTMVPLIAIGVTAAVVGLVDRTPLRSGSSPPSSNYRGPSKTSLPIVATPSQTRQLRSGSGQNQ